MHKAWALPWLLVMATTVSGAEGLGLDHLSWGDAVEYSSDGQNWYPAEYLLHDDSAFCIAGDVSSCDSLGQNDRHYILHTTEQVTDANFIQPADTGPTKAELYGLLTRLENLINTTEPRAAFSTAADMMSDRVSLQQRIEALREVLKDD